MIPDQYANYYKVSEIYTGYFDSLDIMILFSYPSSIIITGDYCTPKLPSLDIQHSLVLVDLCGWLVKGDIQWRRSWVKVSCRPPLS